MAPKLRPAVESPWISRTTNRPQYELSLCHTPLDRVLNVEPFHSIFAVFELPDELILSILSHISPDPQFTGHYPRFRVQYSMRINDYHDQRARFLRSLSMTCRAMRLRFLPWVWERVKCLKLVPCWYSGGGFPGESNAIAGALRADVFLAARVRCLYPLLCKYLSWSLYISAAGS